jgi:thiol-disulfide isomerase/thioredoxin
LNACGIAAASVYGEFRFGCPGTEVNFPMKHFFHATVLLLLVVTSNATADSIFDLTAYRGKVVLLDFWASWCVPCRRSFPWMNIMQEKYGDDGLVIIAVNLDAEPEDRDKFLQEYPARFQIINAHDVVAMPSSYIFGRDGELVTRHLGFKVKRQDEYEAILVESLGTDQEKN